MVFDLNPSIVSYFYSKKRVNQRILTLTLVRPKEPATNSIPLATEVTGFMLSRF